MTADNRPTIARIWRGRTTPRRADEYEAYLNEVGIAPLIEKAMGVQSLREDREDESEFITISYWESVEAMSRFTGGDPTRIHHCRSACRSCTSARRTGIWVGRMAKADRGARRLR
jgi:heme-degrading monooxygenase HmoA